MHGQTQQYNYNAYMHQQQATPNQVQQQASHPQQQQQPTQQPVQQQQAHQPVQQNQYYQQYQVNYHFFMNLRNTGLAICSNSGNIWSTVLSTTRISTATTTSTSTASTATGVSTTSWTATGKHSTPGKSIDYQLMVFYRSYLWPRFQRLETYTVYHILYMILYH